MTETTEYPEETGDPSVPTDLLDLHVQLEDAGVTPEEFKEVYGAAAEDESAVGSSSTETADSEGA